MKQILVIFLLLASHLTLFGIVFEHQPPEYYEARDGVELALVLLDEVESVISVELCYGRLGSPAYTTKKMDNVLEQRGYYLVRLNSAELQNLDIQYWFRMELLGGGTVLFPDTGMDQEPLILRVVEAPRSDEPQQLEDADDEFGSGLNLVLDDFKEDNPGLKGFVLLSTNDYGPQEGEYVLAVSYHGIANLIDPGSIKVYVNDRDVTAKAIITENLLTYRDPWPMKELVKAKIYAKDRYDRSLYSETFLTNVEHRAKKILPHLRGSLNYAGNFNGSDPDLNSYSGWADIQASYKKLNLTLHAAHHNREDSNRQPVDRYSLELSLPSLSAQAGDVTPYFSPLAFGGKNLRGWYGNLYGEYISLELASGDMVRKTVSNGDPAYNTAFQQTARGGKLRLGPLRGLSMSFTLAQNRDNIASLDSLDFLRFDAVTGDTLFVVAPRDNLVAAFETRVNIPRIRTSFGAEIASSLYNSNIWHGPVQPEELADYIGGFDLIDPSELEKIFIINRNMEPLIPGLHNSAGRAWLRTTILNHSLDVNASFTGPAYRALGAWEQKRDLQTVSVSDLYRLGRGFLLSGSYNWQKDNLLSTRAETNIQNYWQLQASLRFFKHFSIRGGAFSSEARNYRNPAISGVDFDHYTRQAQSFNLGFGFNNPRLNWFPWLVEITHRQGSSSTLRSLATDSFQSNHSSYNLNFASKFGKIPLRFQGAVSHAILINENPDSTGESTSLGWQARFSYPFWQDKLLPWLEYRNNTVNSDSPQQRRSLMSLGLDAYPWSKLTVSTVLGLEQNSIEKGGQDNAKSVNWSLSIGQRF